MIKKITKFAFTLLLVLSLAACGNQATQTSSENNDSEKTTLRVAYAPGPYGDMWKTAIAPQLEAKGYAFEYIEFSDYVQPNNALANNEIDVNIFQHTVYLNNFSEAHGLEISAVTKVPTAGMGIWSNTLTSLEEVPDGATITIPNDETNQARGLRVLEAAGLISFKDNTDKAKAIPEDIEENLYHLDIVPTEAAQLPRTLDSAELATVNGNFAIAAGLDFSKALFVETLDEDYLNVIAVRTSDLEADFVADIKDAATNETFKSIIEDPSGQFYTFQKPLGW